MYFTNSEVTFLPTGSTLLDCVLAGDSEVGGWARGRVVNVVGDRSSGKTLLSLEAIANNLITYPKSVNKYADVEAAFDIDYIRSLGVPVDDIQFEHEIYTVEDFYSRLELMEEKTQEDSHDLYILDSLDALSDDAELKREIDDNTYGGNKARKMSELFRRINAKVSHKGITLMVISQVRDMLGTQVKMKTRAGGKALDFYAAQCLWLTEKSKIKRTIEGHERVIGLEVVAKCKKNKVALPYRECEFKILFGYGVDNVWSNLEWLAKVKELDRVDLLKDEKLDSTKSVSDYAKKALVLTLDQRKELDASLSKVVKSLWLEIEDKFKLVDPTGTQVTKY